MFNLNKKIQGVTGFFGVVALLISTTLTVTAKSEIKCDDDVMFVGNDTPANATTITHTSSWCSSNAAYTTSTGTADGSRPSKWTFGPTNNVWFKFQATSTSASVDVKVGGSEGTLRRPVLSLHNSSNTELVSTTENGNSVDVGLSYEGLTVGSWYYINVDNGTLAADQGTFTLCLSNATSYDYQAGAVTLTHNAGCSSSAAYTTMIGTPNGTKPSSWATGPNANVWFKFQASTTSVAVQVKTGGSDGTLKRASVALHNSSYTVLRMAASNLNYDNPGLSYESLTVGNWYYINVDNGDLSTDRGTFTICISDQATADYPSGAVTITHTSGWCSGNAAYTTMIGTPDGSMPSNWPQGPNANIWFKFQATATTVSVDLKTGDTEGTLRRPRLALHNSSMTELRSNCDVGNYTDIGVSYSGLTVGQWYYINVDNGDVYYERGTFTLCVSTSTTNDYPGNATTLTDLNNWCSSNAAYSTLLATPDGSRPSTWSAGPTNNVWFKFQATTATISVLLKTGDVEGTLKRPRLALHNSSFTELRSQCDLGNYVDVGLSYNALTVGSWYYINVDNGESLGERGTFSLCINDQPTYDYPAGAIELTNLGNWCSNLAEYTTLIATPDGARPTNWTYGPTNNVWFKFRANRTNVTINVKTNGTEGTLKKPNVALHNDALTHLTSVHDAGNTVDIAINNYTGLTVGNWYYINVDNGNSVGDRGTFTLCIDNALATPGAFTAVLGTGQAELDWTYTNGSQTGFEIQRSLTAGSGYTTLATVGSSARSYDDATVAANTLYYYRVRATNSAGGSAFTAELPVVTEPQNMRYVTWTNIVGGTVTGNSFAKNVADGWGTSGVSSTNRLANSTNGQVRYVVSTLTAGEFAFGFSDIDLDRQYTSVKYAFHRTNGATTYVRVSGTSMYTFNAAVADVLTIERSGTSLYFKRNGLAVYTVSSAPSNSMCVDAALYTSTAQLNNVRVDFGPTQDHRITWGSLVGVTQTDSLTLTKTASTGYGNAGAGSANILPVNTDGWIEFKLDAFNKEMTFGFVDDNSDNNVGSIDYAFNTSGTSVFVYKNGVSQGAISGAAVNDVFRLWRIGGSMYWLRNGTVVYTDNSALSSLLMADVAINTNGAYLWKSRTSFNLDEGLVPDLVEFQVLKDIYQNMSGSSWVTATNWPTTSWPSSATIATMDTWYGVEVTGKDITGLSFGGNYLGGVLRSSIGNLTALQVLDITSTGVTGLPDEMINLVNLKTLNCAHNFVSANTFPPQVGSLTSLEHLDMSSNGYEGELPSSVFALANLKELRLSDNSFYSAVPSNIGSATSLTHLYLNNNAIYSQLPSAIGNLSNLVELNLSYNFIEGPLPTSIGDLSSLQYLYLDHNYGLYGDLPDEICSLTQLIRLNIESNNVTGPLPEQIGNLTNLTHLIAKNNQLTGPLPTSIGNLIALEELDLGINSLDGSLPVSIGNLSNLERLALNENQLSGTLPYSIGGLKELKYFLINDNDFDGPIPASIGRMGKLINFNANKNNLSGSLPEGLGGLVNLETLWLAENTLSGTLPASIGKLSNVFTIDLHDNHLTGEVPASITSLPNLWFVDLGRNRFTSLAPGFIAPGLSLSLYINPVSLGNLEQVYTGTNQTHLSSLSFYLMGDLNEPGARQFATADTELLITAFSPGAHGSIVSWEFSNDGGSTWTNVTSQNEDVSQVTFLRSYATTAMAGWYRYKQVNSWMTNYQQYYYGISEVNITEANPYVDQVQKRFDGQIAAMRWHTEAAVATGAEDATGMYMFKYDSRNQLDNARFVNVGEDNYPVSLNNKFGLKNLTYDPNGNIKTMDRYDENGVLKHNFSYEYSSTGQRNNQLNAITGFAQYEYDEIGQLKHDVTDGNQRAITYDVSGKVVGVYAAANADNEADRKVTYIYNDRGTRMAKVNHETDRITWYVRDASGSIISIYESTIAEESNLNLVEVPVYGAGKLGTYYPSSDEGNILAYEMVDHLGNVRAIIQDRTMVYKATIEDNDQADISNPRVTENTFFQNLFETEVDDERMNHSPVIPGIVDEPSRAAYLYWNDNPGTGAQEKSIGPALTLRVNEGDTISIEAFARYEKKTNYARNVTATMLASLLGHSFIGQNGLDNVANLTGIFQDGIGTAGFFNTGTDDTKPYAYLNYILFDNEFNFVDAGNKRVDDDGEFESGEEAVNITFDHLSFDTPIIVAEAGYIYIWVSNESKNTKVWFDDLKVVHRGSVVTQSTDYDPWGLVMRETKTDDEFLYRYGYQGAFAEHDEETGWNHFELREFDPVVGRWIGTDPAGQYQSPYVAMGNNPISGTDPDGSWVKGAGFFKNLFNSDEEIWAEHYAEAWDNTLTDYEAVKQGDVWGVYGADRATIEGNFSGERWQTFTPTNSDGTLGQLEGEFACRCPSTGQTDFDALTQLSLGMAVRAGPDPTDLVLAGTRGVSALFWSGKTFSQYRAAYWATRVKPIFQPIRLSNGKVFNVYMELHHWIFPQRLKWVPNWIMNSRLNVRPLNTIRHAAKDSYRRRFLPAELREGIEKGNYFGY